MKHTDGEALMRAFILTAFVAVSACVLPPSVVSSFNGDSVTVQRPGLAPASGPGPEEIALANKTCATAGKTARIASNRMVSESQTEHLFLCL